MSNEERINIIGPAGFNARPQSPAEKSRELAEVRKREEVALAARQAAEIAKQPPRYASTWRDLPLTSGVGADNRLDPAFQRIADSLDVALSAEETVRLSQIADALGEPGMTPAQVRASLGEAVRSGHLDEDGAMAVWMVVQRGRSPESLS